MNIDNFENFLDGTNAALKRFGELILTEYIISIVIWYLYTYGILNSRYRTLSIILGIGTLLFTLINVKFMRDLYFEFSSYKMYIAVSLISYLIFAAIQMIWFNLLSNGATWNSFYLMIYNLYLLPYYLTKIFKNLNLSMSASFYIYHMFFIIVILISPIGVPNVAKIEAELEEEMEMEK